MPLGERTYIEHMAIKTLQQKLAILSDAAKYDASCASSGTGKRDARDGKGLGSTEGSGICHSYAPDGRCISLLKILMTNFCIFDCAYCINRVSSNVARARFSVEEIISLTTEFYRRNYIEGLFLSSGIIQSPDATMAAMVRVVRELRLIHNFRGYIHLKTIPDAAPELLEEAGLYADRLSINVELPTDAGVARFAPEKNPARIRQAMAGLRHKMEEHRDPTLQSRRIKKFAPAGQSTQLIVGADEADDATILSGAHQLYDKYHLRRVYYSGFSPIPDASNILPLIRPPLLREHRLYQADWMLRFYGFSVGEIAQGTQNGMLDLTIDPKLAWALARRDQFPVDVNRAPREMLMRIPGIGGRTVARILSTRRLKRLTYEDLIRMGARMKNAKAFLITSDWSPVKLSDTDNLRARFAPPAEQLALL